MARFVRDADDRAAFEARSVIEAEDLLESVLEEGRRHFGVMRAVNNGEALAFDDEKDEDGATGRSSNGHPSHCACCGARLALYRRPPVPRGGIEYKRDRCAPCQRHSIDSCPLKSR